MLNNYFQTLDENIRKLAQLEDILDKQQFEYMETQLKGIFRAYNFLFSKHQHEEAMTAQREKNAADIRRIEIEHAQLQNQKLRTEQDVLIETKKAFKIFNEHNRKITETVHELSNNSQLLASNLNTYKNAVNDDLRAHKAQHQAIMHKLENRESEFNKKIENQTTEVKKLNEQMAQILKPLQQLVKLVTEASKASAAAAQTQAQPVTENPSPVTGASSSTTCATPTTATEQTPPPSYDGEALSMQGIPAIPVPR